MAMTGEYKKRPRQVYGPNYKELVVAPTHTILRIIREAQGADTIESKRFGHALSIIKAHVDLKYAPKLKTNSENNEDRYLELNLKR